MNEKADLIFGVDTSKAVWDLNRLNKALQGVYDQMGKGSANPSKALAKNSKDASDAVKQATRDVEYLAKSANKAAEQMVTYSQKVGNASYRVKIGLSETYTEAYKKLEDFNRALRDPSTYLGHQKRMMEDLQATQAWSKRRKESLNELVSAEDSSRKKLLSSLRKDIEERSKLQVASHQFEVSQLQKHLQTLTQASTTARQKELAEMRRTIKEREQANRDHERVMTQATQAWIKRRKDSLIELVNAEDSSRKKLLNLLRKDIEERSKIQIASQQFEVSQLQKHLQTLTQASSAARQKELAEMRKTIKEREQATRDHAREMLRIESNIAAQRRRQESLSMGYLESSLQSRLRTLQKIQALQESGKFSTSAIARRHGVEALGDLRNIENIQKQVSLQREMEKIEKQALSTKSQGATVVGKNTAAILKNNEAMRDARGLARGLSGALGQLWLTYGSLGPLVAGAAMGAIARQTYEIGKDVEYRLAMVEALGNRAIRIQEMMPAVHGSMKTPLEAAQGLQELAQAGLTAEQSLMALSTTLQLATLGEMSVAEAALTTTAALSTFNLEVGEAIRVGNVYAKTASVSNTTVQGIAEAMKQAGSAAAIYGVEIEAVAGQIAILAQNGIRGSAAGTAVRNAMTELHAPTQKAQAIMKELGIEIYNSDKTSRDYMEVLGDLRDTYYSLNEESRAAMLRGMFNERSRRFIQIAIKDYDQLKEIIDRVTDSQGFLMEANLKLLDTVEGASNRMQSVLQQSLVEAFDLAKPQIMSAIQNMEQLFASDEFKRGVTTLARAVADLTSFMSDHASTILKVGAAYVGWKLAIRPMIPAMVALAKPLKNITEYATRFGQVMGVLPLTVSKTAPAVTTTAAATTTLWTRIVSITGAVVRFLGPMGLVAGTLLTASTMMNRYRTATEGAAPAHDTLQSKIARATKALNLQNDEIRENLKLRKLAAEGSTPEIHDTKQLLGETESKMGEIVSSIAFQNKQIATLEKVLEDHRTGAKNLSDAALTTVEQSIASSRREISALERQLEAISKDYSGLKGSLSESAEINLQNYNFDVLEGMKRTLQEATFMANSMPENTAVQNAVEGIRYLTEEFERSGGSADDFKASVDALYKTIQQNLGSWTPQEDKSDPASRRLERDLERYDVWLRKQLEAIKTSDLLTKAYLAGEEQVRQYTLAQEIANVQIADRTKHEKQIAEVLTQKNLAETRMNVAKQVADLVKQTKTAEEYAEVLLAQSKGYKEGEDALRAFNKEQARTALLANISADNLDEVLDILAKFDAAYDESTAADDRNKKLGDLNDLINQTKNSTQKYREEMERLEDLRPFAETPEQIAALEQAIRNVTIEANDFLSTFNQGFIDLNQNANDMWRKFLEDGKFSMDSVKSLFRNMLADLAHQALTKPIIISLQNAVMGTNIGGGWGDVWGGNRGGGVGDVLGLASNANTLWGAFSGGLVDSLASGIGAVGEALGSATLTSFSQGMSGVLATEVATVDLIAGTVSGGASGAAGAGSAFAAAVPWLAGAAALAGAGMMIHNVTQGETRSGGGFWRDSTTGQTHFGGGPSGGYGGQQMLTTMDQVLAGFSDSVIGLFDALKINADLIRTTASFESSDKGRGGTSSGGTLIIDGQTLHFGSVNQDGGVVKGKGYGGKSGSAEEMFENMVKDMAFSTLEAWKLAGDRLPNILAKAFEGKEIRQMSAEQASELVAYIQNVVTEVNQVIEALDKLPFKNLTNLTFDLSASLMEAAGGVSNFMGGLDSYYTNFYTEMERGEHATKLLEDAIAELGLTLPPTRQGFRGLVDSLDGLDEANHTTIAGLLNLSAAASEHYDRIGDSLEKLNGRIESTVLGTFENLTSELNRLFSIRNTGRNLADRIAGQLNRDPQNAAKREAELWAQINKGTAEQQITMAEELLGLINARHDLELKRNDKLVESIKEQLDGMRKMLELSISLRDYIRSLETSDLSPNTLRQKIEIAEADLLSQIEKAREGDEDAMGEVQGSLEKALRLWREYGASGQEYQDTYYRLTKMAQDLALGNINSLDPETRRLEQQLETLQGTKTLNEYQLAELENLYNLTESATSKVEDLYDQVKRGLEEEARQLETIGLNTENLMEMRDLLATLPSDIAANLSPLLDRTIEETVEGWYQSGFGTGPDPAGKAYWVDRVQNEGITRPKEEFDQIAGQYPNVRRDVTYWYEHYLGRKPEPEGLGFWVNEILMKGQDQAFADFMGHVNGSHRNGLNYVPYDGYVAELHKGERVLTAIENERYARVGINSNDDILRELQQLRQEVAENTRAVIDMGGHQILATKQAAEQSSGIIVSGVGSAIRERSRDDTIRSNSMRKGIL